jgi:ribosomal protein L14
MTALPELPEPYNCGGDATIAALLREYGRQCYAAGMELAAVICDELAEYSRKDGDSTYRYEESAAAIREAAKAPIGGTR